MSHLPPWGVPPPWGPGWTPRPPSISWPPCPPWPPPRPVLSPPDIAQALKLLQTMFNSTEAFQALVKQAVEQILVADPTWLAGATPTVGVTDGSDASAGMVGQYVTFTLGIPFPANPTTPPYQANVLVGTLPAGDWDCGAFAGFNAWVMMAEFKLQPVPAGFTSALAAYEGESGGAPMAVTLQGVPARALTDQPTPLAFQIQTLSNDPGTMDLTFWARRRR